MTTRPAGISDADRLATPASVPALVMRARAVDSQCFLLACAGARLAGGEGYPSYGHSLVVDSWGVVIAEAGAGEQVLHAELDLAQVCQARPPGDPPRPPAPRRPVPLEPA